MARYFSYVHTYIRQISFQRFQTFVTFINIVIDVFFIHSLSSSRFLPLIYRKSAFCRSIALQVIQQSMAWIHLRNVNCHPDTQLFLCSLFSPVCLDRPIMPCRSLCEAVQSGCEPRMQRYGFSWPEMLDCSKFPRDEDLCIAMQSFGRTPSPEGQYMGLIFSWLISKAAFREVRTECDGTSNVSSLRGVYIYCCSNSGRLDATH